MIAGRGDPGILTSSSSSSADSKRSSDSASRFLDGMITDQERRPDRETRKDSREMTRLESHVEIHVAERHIAPLLQLRSVLDGMGGTINCFMSLFTARYTGLHATSCSRA